MQNLNYILNRIVKFCFYLFIKFTQMQIIKYSIINVNNVMSWSSTCRDTHIKSNDTIPLIRTRRRCLFCRVLELVNRVAPIQNKNVYEAQTSPTGEVHHWVVFVGPGKVWHRHGRVIIKTPVPCLRTLAVWSRTYRDGSSLCKVKVCMK